MPQLPCHTALQVVTRTVRSRVMRGGPAALAVTLGVLLLLALGLYKPLLHLWAFRAVSYIAQPVCRPAEDKMTGKGAVLPIVTVPSLHSRSMLLRARRVSQRTRDGRGRSTAKSTVRLSHLSMVTVPTSRNRAWYNTCADGYWLILRASSAGRLHHVRDMIPYLDGVHAGGLARWQDLSLVNCNGVTPLGNEEV